MFQSAFLLCSRNMTAECCCSCLLNMPSSDIKTLLLLKDTPKHSYVPLTCSVIYQVAVLKIFAVEMSAFSFSYGIYMQI